jgi:hypothetical protein
MMPMKVIDFFQKIVALSDLFKLNPMISDFYEEAIFNMAGAEVKPMTCLMHAPNDDGESAFLILGGLFENEAITAAHREQLIAFLERDYKGLFVEVLPKPVYKETERLHVPSIKLSLSNNDLAHRFHEDVKKHIQKRFQQDDILQLSRIDEEMILFTRMIMALLRAPERWLDSSWYTDDQVDSILSRKIACQGFERLGSYLLIKKGVSGDDCDQLILCTPAVSASNIDYFFDKKKQVKPAGNRNDNVDVFDEMMTFLFTHDVCRVRVVFPINHGNLHWTSGELMIEKIASPRSDQYDFRVVAYDHDPITGRGEMNMEMFELIGGIATARIGDISPSSSIETLRYSQECYPYSAPRQSKGDGRSCGVICCEEIAALICGTPLKAITYSPEEIREIRSVHQRLLMQYCEEIKMTPDAEDDIEEETEEEELRRALELSLTPDGAATGSGRAEVRQPDDAARLFSESGGAGINREENEQLERAIALSLMN